MSVVSDSRAAAESKVELALESLATDEERALLFRTLRIGLDWTTARAELVLRKAGWLL